MPIVNAHRTVQYTQLDDSSFGRMKIQFLRREDQKKCCVFNQRIPILYLLLRHALLSIKWSERKRQGERERERLRLFSAAYTVIVKVNAGAVEVETNEQVE